MNKDTNPEDNFPDTIPQWLNPEMYPDSKHVKLKPIKGSPPERLGSPLDFAMSVLQFRQHLEPVLGLYNEAQKNPDTFPLQKQEELASGFGNLFREIYNARLSALDRRELMRHLFIDEGCLNRLKQGRATYEEAVNILEPLFQFLEELSGPAKLQ